MIAQFVKVYPDRECPCCAAKPHSTSPVWGLRLIYPAGETAHLGKGTPVAVTTRSGKTRNETLATLHHRQVDGPTIIEVWHTEKDQTAHWFPRASATPMTAIPTPMTPAPVPEVYGPGSGLASATVGTSFFIFDLSELPNVEARQQLMADLLDLADGLSERVAFYDPELVKTLTT